MVIHNKKIVIIEACSELGAGTRGASLGPAAIRIRDISRKGVFSGTKTISLSSYDNLCNLSPSETPFAKSIGHIYDFNRILKDTVQKEIEKGHFVLLLSGDHSNAIGGVSGFRAAHQQEKSCVVWIDAHGDLHSPYTTPSGNMHGMPLATLLGLDNGKEKERVLNAKTIDLWEKLKALAKNDKGFLSPHEILFAGIRDLEKEEWGLIDKLGMQHMNNEVFKSETIDEVCEVVANFVANRKTYISFDIDVIDSALSDGTGTPVPNGLTPVQAVKLLQCLLLNEQVSVLELTEVNPLLDTKARTVDVALRILEELFK